MIGADVGVGGGHRRKPDGSCQRRSSRWTPRSAKAGAPRARHARPRATPSRRSTPKLSSMPSLPSVSDSSLRNVAGGRHARSRANTSILRNSNVVFGLWPATTFSVDLSGERITAKTAASPAGTVDVHVSNLHSTSETAAAYQWRAGGSCVAPSHGKPQQAEVQAQRHRRQPRGARSRQQHMVRFQGRLSRRTS